MTRRIRPVVCRTMLVGLLVGSLGLSTTGAPATSAQVAPTPTPTTTTVGTTPTVEPTADAALPTLTAEDQVPPSEADTADGATYNEQAGGGGAKNVVKLNNLVDGRLRVRGNVQLSRVYGPNVGPINLAVARGSCVGCSTYVVALQVAVYQRGASRVVPQNAAVAMNVGCSGCTTVAHAIQYVIPVDDPNQLPDRVSQLVRDLDRAQRGIQAESSSLTVEQAEARVNAVITQFQEFGESLRVQRDAATDTGVDPTPSAEPAAQPTSAVQEVSPSPTATLAATAVPQATEAPAPSPTATPSSVNQATTTAEPSTIPTPTPAP